MKFGLELWDVTFASRTPLVANSSAMATQPAQSSMGLEAEEAKRGMARCVTPARSAPSVITIHAILPSLNLGLALWKMLQVPHSWAPCGCLQRPPSVLPLFGERSPCVRLLQSMVSARLAGMPCRAASAPPRRRASSRYALENPMDSTLSSKVLQRGSWASVIFTPIGLGTPPDMVLQSARLQDCLARIEKLLGQAEAAIVGFYVGASAAI